MRKKSDNTKYSEVLGVSNDLKKAYRNAAIKNHKLPKQEEEEAIRRSNAGISSLRIVSRQEYLKKREQKKLKEIRDDIEKFRGVKLTEREQRDLRYKRRIYELARKHTDDVNEYRMPDAYDQDGGVSQEKRFAVAMQRYSDPTAGENFNPFAEQDAWEDLQFGKASLKFGSNNKKQTSDDYQFVFEDQIDGWR